MRIFKILYKLIKYKVNINIITKEQNWLGIK